MVQGVQRQGFFAQEKINMLTAAGGVIGASLGTWLGAQQLIASIGRGGDSCMGSSIRGLGYGGCPLVLIALISPYTTGGAVAGAFAANRVARCIWPD